MCSGSLSEGTSAARSPPGSCLSWLPCLAWDSQGLGAEASRLETLRLQVAAQNPNTSTMELGLLKAGTAAPQICEQSDTPPK